MIVDAHIHIFPALSGACGFPTADDHRRFLQFFMAHHPEFARRLPDHAVVPESARALHDDASPGYAGLRDEANFRVGPFGRLEWEWQGDTYYRQFFPPSLQEIVSTPEYMLQQMGRVGIDRALVQNSWIYGHLNDYTADAIKQYPDRFIGLATVQRIGWSIEDEVAELRRCVQQLGLRGLNYENVSLFLVDPNARFDDERNDPLWEEVRRLGIPLFWEVAPLTDRSEAAFLEEIERLNRWCDRYPDIPSYYTHGFAPEMLEGNIPEPVANLLAREQMTLEVLFPIQWGRLHDYPYAELRPLIERLYRMLGPSRLIWGSDMPLVERNCLFRQSLDYLRLALDGIATQAEQDAIFGGNLLKLLGER